MTCSSAITQAFQIGIYLLSMLFFFPPPLLQIKETLKFGTTVIFVPSYNTLKKNQCHNQFFQPFCCSISERLILCVFLSFVLFFVFSLLDFFSLMVALLVSSQIQWLLFCYIAQAPQQTQPLFRSWLTNVRLCRTLGEIEGTHLDFYLF